MRNTRNNSTYLRGSIFYEDGNPIEGVVVILLKAIIYRPFGNKGEQWIKYLTCGYATTNHYGEFCFRIKEKRHYYVVRIFNNGD